MIIKNSTNGEFINSTKCNVSSIAEAETGSYDAEGALKFTVAVVMVYGVAVIGVFAVSYVSRRKPQNYDVDKQARTYFKTMDDVRNNIERKDRLNSINLLLKNIHGDKYEHKVQQKSIHEGILSYVAFPVMVASGGATNTIISNNESNSNTTTPTSPNSDYFSRETLTVLNEENEKGDENDEVHVSDKKGKHFKGDFFVPVSLSDV